MAQTLVADAALQKLKAEGWHLKPEGAQAVAESLLYDEDDGDDTTAAPASASAGPVSLQELRAALLTADLRKTGAGCLPDDVNRANSSSIKGPMVLQVMSVTDVSKPSYASSGSTRLLMLKLSDGRTSCKALEHKHCPALSDTLTPGSKVVLHQASVRLGVVLLEPRSFSLLGGRVDSLADAWETQRKVGGAQDRQTMAAAAAAAAAAAVGPAAAGEGAEQRLMSGAAATSGFVDDGAAAPRFRQFVPGRDGKQQPRQQQQQQRAAATTSQVGQQQQQQQQQKDDSAGKRSVDVAPVTLVDAATKQQQSAAQARLLDKLERSQAAADSRGAGDEGAGGRGRGRRRGRWGDGSDSDDDDGGGGTMTLEEYEARQKSAKAAGGGAGGGVSSSRGPSAAAAAGGTAADDQLRRDEELARQLQAQLDLEEGGYQQQQHYGQQYGRQQQQQPPPRGYDQPHRGRYDPGRARGGGGRGPGSARPGHQGGEGQDYTNAVFGDMQPRHFSGSQRGRGDSGRGRGDSGRGRGRGGSGGDGDRGAVGDGGGGGRFGAGVLPEGEVVMTGGVVEEVPGGTG